MNRNITAGSNLGFDRLNQFKVTVRPNSFTYTLFLKDIMDSPEEFIDALSLLSGASSEDVFEIYLNSGGGSIYSIDTLIHAINMSEAFIRLIPSGMVASAATFLMFNCDEFIMSPNTTFLFHSASTGDYGKTQDLMEYANYAHKECGELMKKYYQHFFTEEELEDIIKNKREWYMNVEEFNERYQRRLEMMQAQDESDAEEEALELEATIDAMIPDKNILNKMKKDTLIKWITGEIDINPETGEVLDGE